MRRKIFETEKLRGIRVVVYESLSVVRTVKKKKERKETTVGKRVQQFASSVRKACVIDRSL